MSDNLTRPTSNDLFDSESTQTAQDLLGENLNRAHRLSHQISSRPNNTGVHIDGDINMNTDAHTTQELIETLSASYSTKTPYEKQLIKYYTKRAEPVIKEIEAAQSCTPEVVKELQCMYRKVIEDTYKANHWVHIPRRAFAAILAPSAIAAATLTLAFPTYAASSFMINAVASLGISAIVAPPVAIGIIAGVCLLAAICCIYTACKAQKQYDKEAGASTTPLTSTAEKVGKASCRESGTEGTGSFGGGHKASSNFAYNEQDNTWAYPGVSADIPEQ